MQTDKQKDQMLPVPCAKISGNLYIKMPFAELIYSYSRHNSKKIN